uniref:EGF-like domain-containing protein n=1 Tax=Romanomermis culicivorax TaxID=13658 RepID=A0A915JBL1_ROMCU
MLISLLFVLLRISLIFCSHECSDNNNSIDWLFDNNQAYGYCLSKVVNEKQSVDFEDYVAVCANHGAMTPIFGQATLTGTSSLTLMYRKKLDEENNFAEIVQTLINGTASSRMENITAWVAYRAFSNRCQYLPSLQGNHSIQIFPGSKVIYNHGRIVEAGDAQTASYYICQKKVDLCSQAACRKHGKCQQNGICYECQCFEGYQGSDCESMIQNDTSQQGNKSLKAAPTNDLRYETPTRNTSYSNKTNSYEDPLKHKRKPWVRRERVEQKIELNTNGQETVFSTPDGRTVKDEIGDTTANKNANSTLESAKLVIATKLVDARSISFPRGLESQGTPTKSQRQLSGQKKTESITENISENNSGDALSSQNVQQTTTMMIQNSRPPLPITSQVSIDSRTTSSSNNPKGDQVDSNLIHKWRANDQVLFSKIQQTVLETSTAANLTRRSFQKSYTINDSKPDDLPAIIRNHASQQSRQQFMETLKNISFESIDSNTTANSINISHSSAAEDSTKKKSFMEIKDRPKEYRNLIESGSLAHNLTEKEEKRSVGDLSPNKKSEELLINTSNHSGEDSQQIGQLSRRFSRTTLTKMLPKQIGNESTPDGIKNKLLQLAKRYNVTVGGEANDMLNQKTSSNGLAGITTTVKVSVKNINQTDYDNLGEESIADDSDIGENETTNMGEEYKDDIADYDYTSTTVIAEQSTGKISKYERAKEVQAVSSTIIRKLVQNTTSVSAYNLQVSTVTTRKTLGGPSFTTGVTQETTTDSNIEDEKDLKNYSKKATIVINSGRIDEKLIFTSKSISIKLQPTNQLTKASVRREKATTKSGIDAEDKQRGSQALTNKATSDSKVIPTRRMDGRSPHHPLKTPLMTRSTTVKIIEAPTVKPTVELQHVTAQLVKSAVPKTTIQQDTNTKSSRKELSVDHKRENDTSEIATYNGHNATNFNARSAFRETNIKKLMYFAIGVVIFVAFCCFLCLCAFFRYKADHQTKIPFT